MLQFNRTNTKSRHERDIFHLYLGLKKLLIFFSSETPNHIGAAHALSRLMYTRSVIQTSTFTTQKYSPPYMYATVK